MTDDRTSSSSLDPALAQRIGELSPAKRALLEQQLRARAARRGGIPRLEAGEPAPASFAQELLWSLDRATPGLYAYNVARAIRLSGTLDRAALQRALDLLVARHAALRTRFAGNEGNVVQVIDDPAPVSVEFVDLTAVRSPDAIATETTARVRRPFDLANEHQFRVTLFRQGDDEHTLLWVSHHVALDGWSASILLSELAALYETEIGGQPASLADLAITFADFAAWQREWLSGERLDALLGYWRERLAGAPELIDLAGGRPRPQVQHFEGGQVSTVLPPALVARIRDVAHRYEATPYMVLLAAYSVLLYRYSGSTDVMIGSPVAARTRAETQGVVGYFANTLVHRSDLSGEPTFAELLGRVRQSCLGAFEHQDVPFETLVAEVRQDRGAGHAPLLQCVLTMEDAPPAPVTVGGVTMTPVELDASYEGAAKFDILVLAREQHDGLRLLLEYRTDLFDHAAAERMLGHLCSILESAAATPDGSVARLAMLAPAERAQIAAWNVTTPAPPAGAGATVVRRFLACVEHAPDAPAVSSGDETLSYAQLWGRAERTMAALAAGGIAPGARVGVPAERSIETIAAMLGVLAHGCAYVPLASDLPVARIRRQIADASVVAVIAPAATPSSAIRDCGAPLVSVDVASAHPVVLPADVAPSDVAYVLFTSGSTGTPKGVAVTHGNLAGYVDAIVDRLGTRGERWSYATVSTLAADLGNTAVFPALCTGGTLHVVPESATTDGTRFAEYVGARSIDVLKITPSHIRALLAGTGDVESLLPRRWIVLGGEALPWELADQLVAAGRCRVLNHYGPTETTVGATTYEVTGRDGRAVRASDARTVPIGRPLAGVTLHVLDGAREPVPVGVPGELYISGVGVADSYVGQPALTAERFVVLDASEGKRAYRTGDRVRYLPDGDIEFLGRTDDQVKVRGFRVELGEVTSVLTRIPGVAQAIVLLAEGDAANAEARLVAYVVARQGGYAAAHAERPTPEALRAAAAEALPDYMVPTVIAVVDSIPLTPNGKVDRTALLALASGADGESNAAAHVAPRSATEEALVAIWAEVFKREQVSVTDNFLALGGHSLLAIRALGKMSRQFGVRLPLRSLFDAPTIEQLADVVDRAISANGVSV